MTTFVLQGKLSSRRTRSRLTVCTGTFLILGLAAGCGRSSDIMNGRIVLEFAAEPTAAGAAPTESELQHALQVLSRRLNPDGTREVVVKTVGGNIEVSIPGDSDADRDWAVAQVSRAGSLELALLANPVDHPEIVAQAQATPSEVDEVVIDGRIVAGWKKPAAAHADVAQILDPQVSCVTREALRGSSTVTQMLVLRHADDERVTHENLESAWLAEDFNGGESIAIQLDADGGEHMFRLTSRNLPTPEGRRRHLAILFDDEIHSAPAILDRIRALCQLSGGYTHEELVDLLAALRAGDLGIRLNPIPVRETRFAPDGNPLP